MQIFVDQSFCDSLENRRFRIVCLQIEDLRNCYNVDEVHDTLESIPDSIEEAYIRKLKSVKPKDFRRRRYILSWISVAARRLTTSELAAAPGVELTNPKDLLNICPSNMIRLEHQQPSGEDQEELNQKPVSTSDTGVDLVTFDHPSVKRFSYSSKLQQHEDVRVSQFFVSEEAVYAEFTRLMIDILLSAEQPTIEPLIFAGAPFLPYAARYWHEHMKDGKIIPEEEEMLYSKLLVLFGDPMSPAYLDWIRI